MARPREVRQRAPRRRAASSAVRCYCSCAADNLGRNDFSNLKTFTAPTKTGQRYAAYVRQIGDKRWRIAVECYETVAITSTVGLEVITVS